MEHQKAKFILQSYRGGADASDPLFADALRQTRCDTVLAEWLDEEQAFDLAVRRKLKLVAAPVDLCEAVLAGSGRFTPPATKPPYRLLALAAAVVFLATVAVLWRQAPDQPGSFVAYRGGMVASAAGGVNFDFRDGDVPHIQKWLLENSALSDFVVPAGLKTKPGLGCRTLSWQGKPVGLICFLVGQNEAVHLFIASSSAMPDPPRSEQPQFVQQGDWLTASWTQGDAVYLVTARTRDESYLRKFL